MKQAFSYLKTSLKTITLLTSITVLSTTAVKAKANIYDEALTFNYPGYWILIDSKENKLKLYNERNIVKEFYASIGSSGSSFTRVMGDKKTPTGEFTIDLFNPQSKFRKFFRIDYPRPKHVTTALLKNIITKKEYNEYWKHKKTRGYPPQLTKLGGQIGIHGVGNRDSWIHKKINWTDGCVAVTNQEIEDLSKYINVGTKVVIL